MAHALPVIYTIGYGGRTLDEFLRLLNEFSVQAVADVRRWNSPRRRQEFSGENLEEELGRVGVKYYWFPRLGGYRKFGVDVEDRGIAGCFESEGFRAYATYITTRSEAQEDLEKLERIARSMATAIMCCERLPWRCHRKILADYFVARGFRALHIVDSREIREHKPSKCAVVSGSSLRYV